MDPVRAGTLIVVWVMNRNQTIPASAAGSAEMMMNGSSHYWKFTTIRKYTSTIEKIRPKINPENDERIVSI
jgi:hypothetical protein